jgi:hypothetical protein
MVKWFLRIIQWLTSLNSKKTLLSPMIYSREHLLTVKVARIILGQQLNSSAKTLKNLILMVYFLLSSEKTRENYLNVNNISDLKTHLNLPRLFNQHL